MKTTVWIGIILMVSVGLFGCVRGPKSIQSADLPGLENPSIQVMSKVSKESPVFGSFGWGYSLFKVPPELGVNMSAVNDRLCQAMTAEFGKKGMVFAAQDPDLLISYAVVFDGEINDLELNRTYGGFLNAPACYDETGLYYKRGVLILDVVDRQSKTLLWRGAIMAGIDTSWPENRKQERCDAAIHELLKYYPKP